MSRSKINKARSYARTANQKKIDRMKRKEIWELKYKGRKGGYGVNVAKRSNKK